MPGDVAPDPSLRDVMDRLSHLERLIGNLNDRLQSFSPGSTSAGFGSVGHSTDSADRQSAEPQNTGGDDVRKRLGHLVLQEDNQTRYVSSGFWSKVNEEASYVDV